MNTGPFGWAAFWVAVIAAIAADFADDARLWRLAAIVLFAACVLALFSDGHHG